MGFLRDQKGSITIEQRSESFIIHPNYGYDITGNEFSDELGDFGIYWREHPDPEFLFKDLNDLIEALIELRDS